MRNKWFKRLFPIIALALLAPWPVAYTYAQEASPENSVRVEIAQPSSTPAWTVFKKAIGGIAEPVDLFYVDATTNSADIDVNLYITNTSELVNAYRYLILNIGLYTESNGEWQRVAEVSGATTPDAVLSLVDSQATFSLPGYARYKVTLESGNFRGGNNPSDGNLAPLFYIDVN